MPAFSKKMVGLTLIGLVLTIYSGSQYLTYIENNPSTDNAYINANRAAVNANINGQITSIHIKNNQLISKGALLFEIDPRPFQIALDKSKAEYQLAILSASSDYEAIKIAQTNIIKAKARHELNKKNHKRIQALVNAGKASVAEGDQINTELSMSQAILDASKNQYKQAQAKLGGTKKSNAHLNQAKALLEQAKLNLSFCQVRAPIDGKISQFFSRKGDMVQKGQTLFEIVQQNQWWVDANYKETQLQKIRVGQKAQVVLDMFPDQPIEGHVESISAGTGSAFSLLPAENSAGNWVKITQRIPVKILLNQTPLPLTIGASAHATITVSP